MARSPNCTGAPLFKGRVDVTITYPDPYEPPLLDPPEALPTSEPAMAQIEITITSAMLPVWSPYELEHIKTPFLYAGGKNNSASSVIVYYRLQQNGINVLTGSATIPAGLFYTWSFAYWLGAQQGDVIATKLWASAAGCDWDLKALAVYPTRIGAGKEQLLFDVTVQDVYPPSLAACTIGSIGDYVWFPIPGVYNAEVLWQLAQDKRVPVVRVDKDYGFARSTWGDQSPLNWLSYHSTRRCAVNRVLTRISYTPLNLRV